MKLILKNDYVIPAGTEFEKIPCGMTRKYASGNFEALIDTSKDTIMSIQITDDELECSGLFLKA